MEGASSIPHSAIFLAPHYDDVALSCGGTVAALADAGARPLVVTVFGGGVAKGALTNFARWQHERWGTAAGDTTAVRRAEDRAAAAILGCETRWWPFPDAIYRGTDYLSDEALFGSPVATDAPLAEAIAAEALALPGLAPDIPDATLYVPLAVGSHVDHELCYRAGLAIAGRGRRVLAYEDCPYALLDDLLPRRLAEVAGAVGQAELVPVAATLARRLAAIAAYPSQLAVIFRHFEQGPAVIGDYAQRAGGPVGPVERYWPLLPPSSPR